ncbi:dihydrofolate reductase [Candidatus Gracilibacteria bacterium]|nr:dihydrofolate reductase [Candidatus Gracilibacteria bacterium]
MILAVDDKNGLGKDNTLAWRISEDMKYFRDVTTNTEDENKVNVVIMGRKTWESIPDTYRPLLDRVNCVLTRDENYEDEGCVSYTSLDACLEDFQQNPLIENIYIIGGSGVYNDCLTDNRLDKIYLTRVEGDFGCDVFFDGIPEAFDTISESEKKRENDVGFCFEVYQRDV